MWFLLQGLKTEFDFLQPPVFLGVKIFTIAKKRYRAKAQIQVEHP